MKETKWERIAVIADRFAIPFWIILIIYGAYEINRNNFLGFISLLIGIGALIIDTTFVIKNRKMKQGVSTPYNPLPPHYSATLCECAVSCSAVKEKILF